ncbi:MAG: hypothetical protein HY432_02035 [Candidatus Liptonbacteria bacterium]|nr:hypothetical protein [Candidatus Liptonbacteria bacterium]
MKTVIATTTWYERQNVRAQLALKTAEEAGKKGLPMVVVDGGSYKEFAIDVTEQGAIFNINEGLSMGASRRQAISDAWDVAGPNGAVLWMEPEKWPLISQVFLMEAAMENAGADIVVPARKTMEGYPAIQQAAERLGNMYFAKVTGHELDVWIGPRLIGPNAIQYFLDYRGEHGDRWDSIFVPIIRAIAAGLKVIGCETDYVHPAEQTAAEEAAPDMDLKRFHQLKNLVPGFYIEAKRLGLRK